MGHRLSLSWTPWYKLDGTRQTHSNRFSVVDLLFDQKQLLSSFHIPKSTLNPSGTLLDAPTTAQPIIVRYFHLRQSGAHLPYSDVLIPRICGCSATQTGVVYQKQVFLRKLTV